MAGHDRITVDGKFFFTQIEELKKLQVRVGFQRGDVQSKEGVDMVDIAAWNELGTARAPSRPFLRQSVDSKKTTVERFCKVQLQKVTQGATAEQILNAIGVMQKGLVQDTIAKSKSWAEPNAESTIKMKSKKDKVGDAPLVDTAQMLQSVQKVTEFVRIVPKGGG